jgi:predicted AlkP superfamily pyrophosphatase or phosphodiesterase
VSVSDLRSVAPRHGAGSVASVLPAAVAALRGEPSGDLPLPAALRGLVVLIVDGLGRRLLDAHADLAPFLASAPGVTLDAPFPTTTATSLTSIGTGRSPGEHGIVGYSMAVPGHDRRLVVLTWSWERQDLDLDARDEVPPASLQPHPTVLERAREAGFEAVTVLRPEFATSGLTLAGLRGGRTVPAAGLEATLEAAVGAAAGATPSVVYAHHGDLDAIGHVVGPGTDHWCTELARIDTELTRVAEQLPDDVAMVVTADHGMVHIPPDGFVELADRPDLLDGVRLLTGDGRARQLHTHPGAADDVAAAWRQHAGDRAHVVTRAEAIDAGWFGDHVEDRVRPLIGDVVVSARALDVSWVHRDADPFGGRLVGQHGALTPEEVEVPALVLTRRQG